MVLGVGEFRAEEQVVRGQVQVEASEGRHLEVAELGGESSRCPPMLRSSFRKWR
jgi:hypothetical protein